LVRFNRIDNQLIQIKAYLVNIEGGDEEFVAPDVDREELDLIDCDDLNIDESVFRGRGDVIGPNARCVDIVGQKKVSNY
jgi:hypothetical protein